MLRDVLSDATGTAGASTEIRWCPRVDVGGITYERAVVRTPWIRVGDDLGTTLIERLKPILRYGDLAIVSEKAVTIAEGLTVPAADVTVSSLANRLAGLVQPTEGSRGLSIPEKMEYVLRDAGPPRILLATAAAAVTRPIGLRGGFYIVAGRVARAMDGMRPPFEGTLIPPLAPRVAHRIARSLADRLGAPVAIVDMNDRGGSIRTLSRPVMTRRRLRRILADNPLGQRDERTPIGIVRRISATSLPLPP
jgi:F420-0:gamma-glutamyl ligase